MFHRIPLFFTLYVLLFFISLITLSGFEQGDIVLLINQNRIPFGDRIMPWITFLGDGWFYAILTVVILLVQWRLGLVFVISGVVQAVVSAVLKRLVFSDFVRPKRFFEEGVLSFIEGYEVASFHSFPSGHSISGFAMTALLALVFRKNNGIQIFLLCVALLIGISRIYLLQHFYRDVVAGSILGILIALAVWKWIRPWSVGLNPFSARR